MPIDEFIGRKHKQLYWTASFAKYSFERSFWCGK